MEHCCHTHPSSLDETMRLKSVLLNGIIHEGGCSGVAWRGDASLVSCGEDHTIRYLRPDLDKTAQEERRFADDVYPTGIFAVPSAQKTEIVLITCSDGKYRLAAKANQRVIEAHTGAILSAGWSHDGTMLATAGEDGLLRLWMRNGAFKANLAEHDSPVTCVCWSVIADELVYSVADSVYARSLTEGRQARLWKAHPGATVTTVALSIDGIIVSGGEDCRFKLWDFNTGKNLFSGNQLSQPISVVAWAPSGEIFAVASFETLTLCHKSGYVLSTDYPACATIRALCWSDCGTQLAGACSSGHLLIAHLVDRTLEWNNFEVSTVGTKLCLVTDVNMEQGIREELTFQGQSAGTMSFRHGVLVVATNGGVFVFGGAGQWHRPALIRPSVTSPVRCIRQSKGHLALVDSSAIHIYANNGKHTCTVRHPFLRANIVRLFDLNDEVVLMADKRSIQFFNISTGKQLATPFRHEREIREVTVEQKSWPDTLSGGEQLLSFIDSQGQLYLVCLRGKQAYASFVESQVLNTIWSETSRQLAAIRESQLLLWECPWAFNVAPKLLDSCRHTFPQADIGLAGVFGYFIGTLLSVRATNGAMHAQAISPYSEKIEKAVDSGQWDAALKLARFSDTNEVWCTLACIALLGRQLKVSRDAFTALGQVDRAEYIDKVREQGGQMEGLLVQLLITGGRSRQQVESQMIQIGKLLDAIMLNVYAHQWDRALSLAIKHNVHIDVVLAYRKKFLERFNKAEDEPIFIETSKKYKADDVDYIKIREMVSQQSVVEL
ncbi:intraflagellar transport protein 80 homolog isoform X3 [Varroa jacobsoni]|uniref:intraflagellar transport protein 80 homolog isoform X3 n=1 Tax=Varroa jacobsoni TaxID=62625 RepID=UPI000BF55453|nr:intraflagellar transport protein 80 homolog isoform X3 [Varroa jacobsoni]